MKAWEDKIRKVVPYTPGEQPKCGNMIKLNTNENPYPPSDFVKKAMVDFDADNLRLYPDPTVSDLTNAIAKYHNVDNDMVFAGVGSDDVIAMSFMTFFNSDKPILFPDITYSFYDVWANLFNIKFEQPMLDENFKLVKERYYIENGGIIIPNPNAPTSLFEPLISIEDILKHNQDVIVIIDEAYIDFGGESALSLIDKYENLLVVRTYSKSRSMAGMRIGYAIGNAALIKALNDVKYSFNSYTLNSVSIQCGVASLEDDSYFKVHIKKITNTRTWVKDELYKLGFNFPEPMGNFLFITHPDHIAVELLAMLREKSIFVRHFSASRTNNYLRVTIGTDDEMKAFIKILSEYMKGK